MKDMNSYTRREETNELLWRDS